MLIRVLEPEVMIDPEEARQYDAMDHSHANRQFIDDLLNFCGDVRKVLDVGTGSAQVAVQLCRRVESCRVTASDLSPQMLELARTNVQAHGLADRIELDDADAKNMPYQDGMFDLVMCNGMLHHIAQPIHVMSEAVRVTSQGGVVFFRDLRRPDSSEQVEQLVATHAGAANDYQQQLFRQSLHAALNLREMRDLVTRLGLDPQSVRATSDRHWTWALRRS
jgi:ubiquinone/menaquinone biosynthesis C-methylase UbiE